MPAFDPAQREVWYTDGESGFYDLQIDKRVWPAASAGGGVCTARTKTRHVSVHRDRSTVITVTLTKGGKRVRGRTVRLSGPGFSRSKKTSSKGRASFTVRPSRNGKATVSSPFCGGKLAVKATAGRGEQRDR